MPREFVLLCQEAAEAKDAEALEFCGRLMNAEWRLLLDHVLAKAQIALPAPAGTAA